MEPRSRSLLIVFCIIGWLFMQPIMGLALCNGPAITCIDDHFILSYPNFDTIFSGEVPMLLNKNIYWVSQIDCYPYEGQG
jgi:hypothetical protein